MKKISLSIIGDSGVGKTSMIKRYLFPEEDIDDQMATSGLELMMKKMKLYGEIVKVVFQDTAGQERFRALAKTFYRAVDGMIVAYDITNV